MDIAHPVWADAAWTTVSAQVDGEAVFFPADPENRHYAALLAADVVIGAYVVPAAPPAALVPITRRQLRLTLLAHGHLAAVEPAIAALPEPDRSVALIEWQDASEYRRDHPLIAQIGAALDLDAASIDAMWREALLR